MYNGMMDPELMRLAQEQMSKIPPSELAKMQQQMMSNPDLIRMASERMKNMRTEDFRNAAEQMKHARVEDMAEIGKKIASASPEEIAAMTSQADAQIAYVVNGSQMLKKQGNEFHSQGKFSDAAEKYLHAKKNLKDIPVSKGRTLQLACSLNLMSCYLKTRQYDDCIKEGTEVLEYDSENVKALYRRGQAYKELGLFEEAVSDLTMAYTVSPDDETIADVLRDAEERLSKEGGDRASKRSATEETIEEIPRLPRENHKSSTSAEYIVTEPLAEYIVTEPLEADEKHQTEPKVGGRTADADSSKGMDINPDTIRSFQNLVSTVDPDTLAALSGGSVEGMSPDMMKTAANMIGKMPPDELQKMLQMASSFQGKNPLFPAGSGSAGQSLKPGTLPEGMSPDMLKTASDMMNKMPPEELQKMFEIASNLRGTDSSKASGGGGIPAVNRNTDTGESSSSRGLFSNSMSDPSPSNLPTSSADLQQQMRNQMNDPAMRQMFSSMIKNMSPDMMANMSEQFGVKMSKEEAAKAQQAMSSLSPDALDSMMRWADRIQRGADKAKKTKNWLLGRPGMILAVCMLILAIILHRLGFIGS